MHVALFDTDPEDAYIIGYARADANGNIYTVNRSDKVVFEHGESVCLPLETNDLERSGYTLYVYPIGDYTVRVLGQAPITVTPNLYTFNVVKLHCNPDPSIIAFDPFCFSQLFTRNSFSNIDYGIKLDYKRPAVECRFSVYDSSPYLAADVLLTSSSLKIKRVTMSELAKSYVLLVTVHIDVNWTFGDEDVAREVMACLFHPFGQHVTPSREVIDAVRCNFKDALQRMTLYHFMRK